MAGITCDIELVPSVIILPSRQTVLVAKQVAELDVLSEGRVRLGVGVGGSPDEYTALGANFPIRGDRCEEQIQLLKRLWTEDTVNFAGKWDTVSSAGLNPLPIQRPVPIWIGASALPIPRIRRRVGGLADGWFVLCSPEEYPSVQAGNRDGGGGRCGRFARVRVERSGPWVAKVGANAPVFAHTRG